MCEMKRSDHALSETLAVVFMAMLVVVVALLLIASMTGVIAKLLQKPAILSVQALQYNDNGAHIIGVFHQQGDAVNLNGTAQTYGVSIVSLAIIDTTGTQLPVTKGTIIHDAWRPGELLNIYRSGSSYMFTDDPGSIPGGSGLTPGTYTVKIIDDKVHALLDALPVTIQ